MDSGCWRRGRSCCSRARRRSGRSRGGEGVCWEGAGQLTGGRAVIDALLRVGLAYASMSRENLRAEMGGTVSGESMIRDLQIWVT